MPPVAAGFAAQPAQSRPALALVIIVHACCIFALAKLMDAHRIALREPLIVELLETPKPEIEKSRPKVKRPEPKVETPPPPQEKPPEPKVEGAAPERPELRPEIPPRPLPQADLPLPVPIVQAPREPEPIHQQVAVQVPRVTPVDRTRHEPMPDLVPRQMPEPAPQPVVQHPIASPIEPPPRLPQVHEDVRARPLPPVRVAQAPSVLEMPRMQDPILKVERDVPEARPVSLAPREPQRRVLPEKPTEMAAVGAPVERRSAEPHPQAASVSEAQPVSLAPREPQRRVCPKNPLRSRL